MVPLDVDEKIRRVISRFPPPHRDDILRLWEQWVATSPAPPYYVGWSAFAREVDDSQQLYSEKRIYMRRVTNELRELEVPKTMWQKVAKALAAVASFFLVVFLALSRVARGAD
ncbi:MAG: hypothetical protein ACTSVD_05580 [Candidatus Thorarchaeota archaeon]|nr:MAG: hypothetical protein DRO73_04415 [Candidatus Thorarchaeota archaeon]RLI62069.1 MAG: hypothetical protein DRO93_02385 [Candidatus Thorarchaeota archaeon]